MAFAVWPFCWYCCTILPYGGLRPNTAVDKILYMVAMAGWVGVDLFFVLSGFLITGLLYDARGEHFYFRHFYIRRCLRIFPLYYAVLVLFFVVLPRLREVRELGYVIPPDQMWYWTYSVNAIIAADGWPQAFLLGHFWSLAVEEQFYSCGRSSFFSCRYGACF